MVWIAAVVGLVVAGALVGAIVNERREERRRRDEPWRGLQYLPDDPDDVPDNDRFESWEEAFNRAITDQRRFWIEYVDRDGVITEREIEPTSIHLMTGRPEIYIRAFCHLRGAHRTFRSTGIRQCVNLATGRHIRDLGGYLRRLY